MKNIRPQVVIYPRTATASQAAVLLRCPSDKSLTHRAVMFAAMAKGSSRVHAPLLGEDCLATMRAFRALGVSVEIVQSSDSQDLGFLRILSPGWDGWTSPAQQLDFANSGTTARLLLGVFAATPKLDCDCTGDESLQKRPMLRVVSPLRKMGAHIEGEENGNFLPLHISGRQLKAGDHSIDKASAQVKSALCLAGLNCEGVTKISLPRGSRTHTELFLKRFGAQIKFYEDGALEHIEVSGPFRPKAFIVKIPADPSSAAFFAVLAGLHPGLKVVLTEVLNNATRVGFLVKLQEAGLCLSIHEDEASEFCEPILTMTLEGQLQIKAFTISSDDVPTLVDEVPILAVLAAFAEGDSRFSGLHELRVKESDRLAQTVLLLQKGGVSCKVEGDDLIIHGNPAHRPEAFHFDPLEDHRLAMAAAVLATKAVAPCTIMDPDCVKVSFPGFYDFLKRCGVAFE